MRAKRKMIAIGNEVTSQTDVVPILFVCNDAYALYLAVALNSLVKHAGDCHYDINVFCNSLSARNQAMLQRCIVEAQRRSESPGEFSLNFIDIGEYAKSYHFLTTAVLPEEAYYRLFAPDMLKNVEKILYLDADILVKVDVAELYAEADPGEEWISACRWDFGIIGILRWEKTQKKHEWRDYFTKVLGLKRPADEYVNSGVMVMNLRAMRREHVQKQLLRAAQTVKTKFCDQCIINMVCRGHIRYIDSVWNGLVSFNFAVLSKKHQRKALLDRENRKIIHWAASRKPWKLPQVDGADEWWDVARETPFYEEILYTNICTLMREEMSKVLKEQDKARQQIGV